MAGSLNSIIGDDGHFTMEDINNLEDAEQALHQCFEIIRLLTGGNKDVVNRYCSLREFQRINTNMKASKLGNGIDPWYDERTEKEE